MTPLSAKRITRKGEEEYRDKKRCRQEREK
jgi:hypothetical protein